MKIATVFLVAVAVFTSLFLESSAESDLESKNAEKIALEKEHITKLKDTIKKNEANCNTDALKEYVAGVVKFTDDFNLIATDMNQKLWDDLKVSTNRKKITIELLEAILEVLLGAVKLIADSKETLPEIDESFETTFVDIVVTYAFNYAKMLIKELENSTNQAVDESISPSMESFNEAFLGSVLVKLHANQKAKTAEVENVIEEYMAKCSTDTEKEILATVKDFVEYFIPLATNVDKNLVDDVKNPKNRESVIIELLVAAIDVVLRVQKLKPSLTGTLAVVWQTLYSAYVETVGPGAAIYAGLLETSLPTDNSCASQQSLSERMAESENAVDEIIKRVQNAMDEATEDNKSGITELYNWLEDFKLLVVATHEKLKEAEQGSSADRDALASELKTIIEEIVVKLVYFVNSNKIPDSLIALLYKYIIIPVRNAGCVAEQWTISA